MQEREDRRHELSAMLQVRPPHKEVRVPEVQARPVLLLRRSRSDVAEAQTGDGMSARPNRAGILECSDCGEYTHVKHARDGRCTECDDRYQDECVLSAVEDLDDGDSYEAAEERLRAVGGL